MSLLDQLYNDLKPEIETTDINEAVAHLNNGGRVFHNGQEVTDLYKLIGDGYGKYKGHVSGDFMNGIFILK